MRRGGYCDRMIVRIDFVRSVLIDYQVNLLLLLLYCGYGCGCWTFHRELKIVDLLWILDLSSKARNRGYGVDNNVRGFAVGGHHR